ncbi:MAG TPA: alpha/beta hydrolase [Hyphomonadaceae bacterium]|nr:alpha/beta hydrolase [Hyphomonadaceae bacterium]
MCAVANPVETIRLTNGLSLQYREGGDPKGRPVILLHGVTDSLRCWKPFADVMPQHFRTIAVSQRGHGDSSKPKGDYSSAAFSGDLAALMDALGIGSAHIVAHSMSTWIAQRFVLDYAERVESLTLIGGFVTLEGNPLVEGLVKEIHAMGDTVDRNLARAFQEGTVATPLAPLYLDMVVEESMKAPAHVWRATFAAMLSEKPEPANIDCPTLLIGCGKDEFFSDADRHALASVFSNAREIFYPDLGHAPHWEQPARVARDIVAFIG